jgi:hypothetical protein
MHTTRTGHQTGQHSQTNTDMLKHMPCKQHPITLTNTPTWVKETIAGAEPGKENGTGTSAENQEGRGLRVGTQDLQLQDSPTYLGPHLFNQDRKTSRGATTDWPGT